MLDSCKLFQSVCLLFVILGKGEGRAGEFWYFFFQKKRVGRTLRFRKKKKSWPPPPPPTFRWLTKVRPSPYYHKFHAVETSWMSASWNTRMWTISVGYLHLKAEVWIWYYKLWDFVSPPLTTPTSWLYPHYRELPNFDYLPGMKTSTSGRKPDKYQPRAQIKQMFQEGKLKAGDKKAIKEFLKNTLLQESFLQIILSF